jgi:hypothetical protein
MIAFSCPNCGKGYSVNDEFTGRKTACTNCNTKFRIPGAIAIPVAPAERPKPIAQVSIPYADIENVEEVKALCPYCDEEISPSAKKCKHCGEMLDVALRREQRRQQREQRAYNNQQVVINQTVEVANSFPHSLHLVLTIFTCGAWLPIWILHYLIWLVFG